MKRNLSLPTYAWVRQAIIALLCTSALFAKAQKDVLTEADQMPYFMGCEQLEDGTDEKRACSNDHLVRFIANHLEYPEAARQQNIEGLVYINFIVDEEGKVHTPKVIRDIGGECGAAALDIVRQMPSWEPAVHEGEKASVLLSLPVRFDFKEDDISKVASTYQINWGDLTENALPKSALKKLSEQAIYVRDAYGNDKVISELIFAFERRKSYLEESSNGKINKSMKELIDKCKKGGQFTVTAVIQVDNNFVFVRRAIDVI